MIKKKPTSNSKKIEVDLTCPEGNAFCLIGLARRLGKQLGIDVEGITKEMMSGDYENVVKVFDREFSNFVILYR